MSDSEKEWIQQEIQRMYDSNVRSECTIYYVRVMYTMLVVNANNDPASNLLRNVLYTRHQATDDIQLMSMIIANMKKYAAHIRASRAQITTPVQPMMTQGEYYKNISSYIVAITDTLDRPVAFDNAISGFITRIYSLLYIALMDKAKVTVPYRSEIISLVCVELGHMYSSDMTPLSLAYTVAIASFKNLFKMMNIPLQMSLFTWAIRMNCEPAMEALLELSDGKLMNYGYYLRSKQVYTTPLAVAIDSSGGWGAACNFLCTHKDSAGPDDPLIVSTRRFIQLYAPHLDKGG